MTDSTGFQERVTAALANPQLRRSLNALESSRSHMYKLAFDPPENADELKRAADEVRARSVRHMGALLEQYESQVVAAGGQVHWAVDAAEANAIVAGICEAADARLVTKSKSMVTEEIELVAALQARGIKVVETDLGEYIIQLRGEKPSHITAPALHLTLPQVIEAFNARHDLRRDEPLHDADQVLAEARLVLREKFLHASVGITGANMLVAETGSAVVITNEGNADLTTALTDTHIVVTGIEKVVPTLEDAAALLNVLPRAAVGQRMTTYTSFYNGPRRAHEAGGPDAFHVVLVDNGRSSLLGSANESILKCIRCGACMNHCPVYAAIGGHAYGSVYPGPMGAVLTPQFAGLAASHDLPNASTFCGRCAEVCPVGIPLPKLMRNWREDEFSRHIRPASERYGLKLWAWLGRFPWMYRLGQRLSAAFLRWYAGAARDTGWMRHVPWAGRGWSRHRDFPVPPAHSFQRQWATARRPKTEAEVRTSR